MSSGPLFSNVWVGAPSSQSEVSESSAVLVSYFRRLPTLGLGDAWFVHARG
jgi:hypothetical protein